MNDVRWEGLFLGTAIGDAIGLPREGLSRRKAQKIFGRTLKPALVVIPYWQRMMTCSDDTEHLWLTATVLLQSENNVALFEEDLARQLKIWSLALPVGAGAATLKACGKLLLGISPKYSGVYSAGNGAVMRAPVIGAYYAEDEESLIAILYASTYITHQDPKVFNGALAVALAAALLMENSELDGLEIRQCYFDKVFMHIKEGELHNHLKKAQSCLVENSTLQEYADQVGILTHKGISGYVNHTVPAVIYAWLLNFGDYEQTITDLIMLGGDTDSTAAIAGALSGITVGSVKMPQDWLLSIYNAPLTMNKLKQMSEAMARRDEMLRPKISFIAFAIRNILLLPIILLHGFRRLLPF